MLYFEEPVSFSSRELVWKSPQRLYFRSRSSINHLLVHLRKIRIHHLTKLCVTFQSTRSISFRISKTYLVELNSYEPKLRSTSQQWRILSRLLRPWQCGCPSLKWLANTMASRRWLTKLSVRFRKEQPDSASSLLIS